MYIKNDIKTLNIETVLKLKDKILYVVIIEDNIEIQLQEIFNYFKSNKVTSLYKQKQYITTIAEIDGYRSKNNPNVVNLFLY